MAFILAVLSSCKGCDKDVLATLSAVSGRTERDLAQERDAWRLAEIGAEFRVGDGLRTGVGATAQLSIGAGATMKVESETLIRFQKTAPEAPHQSNLDVEFGHVTLEPGAQAFTLHSALGTAIIQPGSRVRIGMAGNVSRYEVQVGLARFRGSDGAEVEARAGERIEVDIALATIEVKKKDVPPPQAAPLPEPGAEDTDDPGEVVEDVAAPEPAAIEAEVRQRPARYRSEADAPWKTLALGHHTLAAGGDLSLEDKGVIDLRRGKESARLRGRGDFKVGAGRALVKVTSGQVSFDKARNNVVVTVPGGTIVVRGGGTNARLTVDDAASTELEVGQGQADASGVRGSETLAAGETLHLSGQGVMEVLGRTPTRPDFVLTPGESPVVHDPSPPSLVGFTLSDLCDEGGEVRVGARRVSVAAGTRFGVVPLDRGRHGYEARCRRGGRLDGSPVRRGLIRILRDAGTVQLPRSAPASMVDTDGRRYTVLYQNLLPEIDVRWPKAPRAPRYQLSFSSNGKARTVTTTEARHHFSSAELSEGTHTLAFAVPGGPRTDETTLTIRFDNAAPTAVVKTPADRSFATGEKVLVSGLALPGWQVTVAGQALPLDAEHRFSGEVLADPEKNSLAIRFQHQERGTHYYLRRAARSNP